MDGELEKVGDKWRLRLTRMLAHPAEKVWRAVTDPQERKAWFPDTVEGEFVTGASLKFVPPEGVADPFEGTVLVADPPSTLEFTWGTDVVRIEIEATDDGCILTLLDTIDEVGKAARDGAGWQVCVDKLVLSLDGTAPPWSDGDRWRAVHGEYVAAFGPEAATIGPPADWSG